MYKDARNFSEHIAHPAQAKLGMLPFPDKLYVITPVINSQRFINRYELYRAFEKHMLESGVIVQILTILEYFQ